MQIMRLHGIRHGRRNKEVTAACTLCHTQTSVYVDPPELMIGHIGSFECIGRRTALASKPCNILPGKAPSSMLSKLHLFLSYVW